MNFLTRNSRIVRALPWLGALMIVVLAIMRLRQYYPLDLDASGNSDAFHTYLPGARKWLADGWGFFLHDPFSTRVAPLGYLWPALWQADVTAVRWANGGLFVISALMMAQAARRLGGWVGAVVAVLLLLYNPGIAYYMPKVLTEPLYLFGVLLLSWSLIEILLRPGLDRARWFVLAGIGLTITLLTRPVLQIMVIGAIVMTWLLLLLTRSSLRDWRPLLRKILVTLIAACALPAAVVIKNGMQFGIWSMGTGSGAGLYYGVNPLRLGHEPSFVGFEYDIGEVVRVAEPTTGGEPLDRTADQIERKVAISVLQNTRMQDLLAFLGLKLRSWLLYSPPELAFEARLRKFRLFEWLCIAAALIAWLLRRRPTHSSAPLRAGQLKVVVTLLGLGVTGMLMQLTPLLYNTRYNAGFIEPWLILLTAAAVGSLLPAWQMTHDWTWRSPRWRQAAVLLALMAITNTLTGRSNRHEVLRIDPERLGPVASVLNSTSIGPASADALAIGPQQWRLEREIATLEVRLHENETTPYPSMNFMDGVWRFHLRVLAPAPTRCRTVNLRLEHAASASDWPKPELPIIADGQWRTYAIHGNHHLRPVQPGRLWLSINCAPGTEISWGGAELLRSTMPEAARALWRDSVEIDPYTPLSWNISNSP